MHPVFFKVPPAIHEYLLSEMGMQAILCKFVFTPRTMKGVKDVTVNILETKDTRRTKTGGNFSFRKLEPGAYTLEIARTGYQPQELSNVTVTPGQTTRVEVELLNI